MAEPAERSGQRRLRPAPLVFEPAEATADPEHFFDLESIEDPRRFDRLTAADVAERAEWTEDYALKMIEFGRGLIRANGRPAEE